MIRYICSYSISPSNVLECLVASSVAKFELSSNAVIHRCAVKHSLQGHLPKLHLQLRNLDASHLLGFSPLLLYVQMTGMQKVLTVLTS
jgi:hypothetical protein